MKLVFLRVPAYYLGDEWVRLGLGLKPSEGDYY
jgi:hypothetical protein